MREGEQAAGVLVGCGVAGAGAGLLVKEIANWLGGAVLGAMTLLPTGATLFVGGTILVALMLILKPTEE